MPTITQIVLVGAFLILVILIARSLLRSNKSARSKINLEDLLIGDDGKTSRAAAVLLGSFAMTTWMMIYLTLSNRLNTFFDAFYILMHFKSSKKHIFS